VIDGVLDDGERDWLDPRWRVVMLGVGAQLPLDAQVQSSGRLQSGVR